MKTLSADIQQSGPRQRDGGSPSGLPACPVCAACAWSAPAFGTRLRSCAGCGTVLNDRSASRQEEEQLYDHCESVPVQDQDTIARRQWEWVRAQFADRAPESLSVLDIGCGSGSFLRAARAAGARAAGLELDPVGLKACRVAGLEVSSGSLFDVGVPEGPWDVVTFWDVLDHLEHPGEAIRIVAREMRPGGLVVLRGRNARLHAPLKRLLRRFPFLTRRLRVPDVTVVHRWGFSPAGWKTLLQKNELDPIQLYPGLPTPGNRYATLGTGTLISAAKSATLVAGVGLFRASAGRVYPFPSVLVAGRTSSRTSF